MSVQQTAMADLSHVVLRPVRGHHAFEACVEQLATAIRLGVFPLGGALPNERDLAERLSVSRATLREAMAALREAGLVKTVRGRSGGTVVILKPKSPTGRMTGRTLTRLSAKPGWTPWISPHRRGWRGLAAGQQRPRSRASSDTGSSS
ncbi:MAG: GntR family transcriptional regulator [Marmoricola sp.]